jgi:sarcosine oxidase
MTYDVIVIGLGGMGSATAAELACRGLRVLGMEQFDRGHGLGSSHGHSRIIRTAYFEHPDYVPLCRAAFAGWYELEQRTGRQLLIDCPCLTLGPPDGELVSGVLAAAKQHNLEVDSLTYEALRHRYPQFRCPDRFVGVLEHASGILLVDECVRTLQNDAIHHGAELRFGEDVVEWKVVDGGVAVRTKWETLSAAKLVITAGSWAGRLLADLQLPLTVMRQVPMWFRPDDPAQFRRDRFPIFILDAPEGNYYGMPMLDQRGIKVARHYGAPELNRPDQVQRDITVDDEIPIRRFLETYLPTGAGPRAEASVCLYTLTPDRHFIIDRHPEYPQVAIAAGFSGHGFKFAPVVGEMLADLASGNQTPHRIDMFTVKRPSYGI